MDLKTLSSHWDRWGASDPLWSVLSVPGRRFNGWDETEFFTTGLQEIAGIFSELDALGLSVTPGRALDFGCGVGRLTSALADRFTKVDGVDIAPSMVAHSQRRFGTDPRMSFFLLEDDNLSLFPSGRYDFIYTAHVLQHMEPRYSQRYVQEFVRVLAPAGVAVVEITTVPYVPRKITAADSCMDDDGFRARLEIIAAPDLSVAGNGITVSVLVANESSSMWRAHGTDGRYQVTLAHRWQDPHSAVGPGAASRAPLPKDIPPGESVVVECDVTAPATPGVYTLEVDLVQEGCAWFGNRGSTPARIPMHVSGTSRQQLIIRAVRRRLPANLTRRLVRLLPDRLKQRLRGSAAEEEPVMEMYGVPEPTMRRWVEQAGGRVVEVLDWARIADPGTDWVRRIFVLTRLPHQ